MPLHASLCLLGTACPLILIANRYSTFTRKPACFLFPYVWFITFRGEPQIYFVECLERCRELMDTLRLGLPTITEISGNQNPSLGHSHSGLGMNIRATACPPKDPHRLTACPALVHVLHVHSPVRLGPFIFICYIVANLKLAALQFRMSESRRPEIPQKGSARNHQK